MSRPTDLEAHLRARRAAGRKLLVPYLTGGLGPWREALEAIAHAGADAIEIGLPFSDPVMDGPVIQEASTKALAAGATPASIVDAVRGLDLDVPLVVMTYANIVFRAGWERFAKTLADCGIAGAIVPDLPLEESGSWEDATAAAGVAPVLLVSPVTPDERLARICERSRGFVYGVNLMGVTGERAAMAATSGALAVRMKGATDRPVLMGLGVSTPAQAVEVAAPADGAIVGSAIVRRMLAGAAPEDLGDAVAEFRRALDA